MDADRIGEQKSPKPAWVLPIIGTSVLIVLGCLGAYIGPKVYYGYRAAKLARTMEAAPCRSEEFYKSVHFLMAMNRPEADAFIARFAAARPMRIWRPKSRLLVMLDDAWLVCLRAEGTTCDVLESRPPKTLKLTRLDDESDALAISFRVDDRLADKLNVLRGTDWVIRLTESELPDWSQRLAIYHRQTKISYPDGLVGFRRDAFSPDDGNDEYAVIGCLRKAGALPAPGQTAPGSGQ